MYINEVTVMGRTVVLARLTDKSVIVLLGDACALTNIPLEQVAKAEDWQILTRKGDVWPITVHDYYQGMALKRDYQLMNGVTSGQGCLYDAKGKQLHDRDNVLVGYNVK